MSTPVLQVQALNAHYGHVHALKGVDLEVREGEIVTLIGANGAGKSTTLRSISGLVQASGGELRFFGQSIKGLSPAQVARRGLVQVPEGRRIFTRLTVKENLELGAYLRRDRAGIAESMADVYRRFPRLLEREKQIAGTLSGGEQQMLAIGRALMAKPKLLLLDEPSMGLAPIIVKQIMRIIVEINQGGIPVLLVEQNAQQALKIAKRGYVLETGAVKLHDTGEALLASEAVRAAYLGGH